MRLPCLHRRGPVGYPKVVEVFPQSPIGGLVWRFERLLRI